MKSYVLGVDGGGTKTKCALYDVDGNEVSIIDWGPTNHEVLKGGYDELRSEMSLLISHVMERNNIKMDQIIKCVFGLAGVDTKEQHRRIEEILKDIGFKNFILCNDAFLVVKAGAPDGYGIGVVNGTGCCVAGIDHTGKMLQIGGQGGLTGDLGGGVYLGEQAIKSVYSYLLRCGEYTSIIDFMPDELKFTSKYDFMERVREKIDQGLIKIPDLNRVVFEAANKGDKLAIDILETVGKELAASVNGMLRELEFNADEEISIVLAGSINTKGNNPALIDRMKQDILSTNKEKAIRLKRLDKPPVLGAVIWALEDTVDRDNISARFFKKNAV